MRLRSLCCESTCSFNPRPDPKTGAMQLLLVLRIGRHAFQSAPRSEDRGDVLCLWKKVRNYSFNPRPDPKTGAIFCRTTQTHRQVRFNPRPDPKTGAITPAIRNGGRGCVSIRAPIRRPGRLPGPLIIPPSAKFQSAPRSEDRGDTRSATSTQPSQMFQSAPRSEDRGDG